MASRAPVASRVGSGVVLHNPGIGPVVVLAMVVAVPVGLALMLDGSTYDTWGAFVWGPVLLFAALPFTRWVATRSGEAHIAGFLFFAAALKIVGGASLRYYMVDALYGAGDSTKYDEIAGELAPQFRSGIFENLGEITGTRFLEILNGLVQAVIGETFVGTFLVFSAFAFVGLCLIYLAFCEMLPHGDRRLYRWLLFLTPTLWFWPSSVGKEAFLMLCLGGASFGYALLLHGRLRGGLLAALGMWGAIVVRPHIALMFFVGAAVALPQLGRRPSSDDAPRSSSARFAVPILLVAALPLFLGAVEDFFQLDGLNLETATTARDDVERRTSGGGSEFTAPDTSNPVGLAAGLATVIVRPFPWEASGFARLASFETALLAVFLAITAWRRRHRFFPALIQQWPRLSIAYVVAFGWGFSAVSNFGILARQRSLMLPFLFVVFAASQRRAVELPEAEGITSGQIRQPRALRDDERSTALLVKAGGDDPEAGHEGETPPGGVGG